jgi:hypothetical protein
MATSNKHKSVTIGVIAEDKSDVEVVKEIFRKYSSNGSFSVKPFVGSGCGRLKSKCKTWTETLFSLGCSFVVIMHDRDSADAELLRQELEKKVSAKTHPGTAIVIPVEELEAWLLSDESALKAVFSMKQKPKRYKNCENVPSPKEEIAKVVYSMTKKRYLNTVHNKRIAELTTISNLRRCASFLPLDKFLRQEVFAPKVVA